MWLRDLIFKDFWLKLFSLALAILIWIVVTVAIRKETPPDANPQLPVAPPVSNATAS
jgi:uncharacterized membrane-anchored protein